VSREIVDRDSAGKTNRMEFKPEPETVHSPRRQGLGVVLGPSGLAQRLLLNAFDGSRGERGILDGGHGVVGWTAPGGRRQRPSLQPRKSAGGWRQFHGRRAGGPPGSRHRFWSATTRAVRKSNVRKQAGKVGGGTPPGRGRPPDAAASEPRFARGDLLRRVVEGQLKSRQGEAHDGPFTGASRPAAGGEARPRDGAGGLFGPA